MERYDPKQIEPKWQHVWADERTWEVSNEADERPKAYVLEMLPYPSGEPHIGHLKTYSVGDAVAHFRRRNGYRVLHPMGYDAFGLPAENHAIKTGQHPRESTEASIAEFRRQFRRWGVSIDWTREFGTHEPRYYRWTQWIFLRLFEKGLAYRKEAAVKWCPKDATVLANEQVIDGRCERCGTQVEVSQLEQWFFRITDYADRLLDDMRTIEWPAHVVTMQGNWIGRSEGAEVVFRCEERGIDYPVFTTRPDTLFGATFFVMAPEHPDVFRLTTRPRCTSTSTARSRDRGGARRRAQGEDGRGARPHGHQPGERRADPDVRGRLRADGVRHRGDHGRARPRRARLRVRSGLRPADRAGDRGRRAALRRRRTDGELRPLRRHAQPEAYEQIVEWLASEGNGKPSVNYRLRDWLLSRQRYWGCPIPIIHCDECGLVPVPDDQLPVELPDVEDYRPKGKSPLAAAEDWVNVELPELRWRGAPRDRHDGHLRRLVLVLPALLRRPQRPGALGPRVAGALDAGGPVHRRRGARDPAPALRALLRQGAGRHGLLDVQEPFARLFTQGMITRDGAKMSKSKGNTVSPRDDRRALRRRHRALLHPLHRASRARAPTGRTRAWGACTASCRACGRRPRRPGTDGDPPDGEPSALLRKAHWAIDKVTRDTSDRFAFNTAIAAVMELVNEIYRQRESRARVARALCRGHRRLADLPVRAAPRRRGLRADDRRARVGGALARG